MSIYNVCLKCRHFFALASKNCPKCQTKVPAQGKKFKVVVKANKKRYTKVVNDSLTLARQAELEMKSGLENGVAPVAKNKITLDDAFKNYSEKNQIKNMDHLKWDYEKHIKPRIGFYPLQKISPAMIEALKYDLLKTLSPKTTKNIIMIISAAFNFAKRIGYSGENPLEKVQKPKIQNEVMHILTDAQRESLVKVLDAHPRRVQALAIKLLIYTGLRISEALKLEWRDVDFDKRSLYIRDAKSGYNEAIPLNETAIQILQERRDTMEKDSPLVFQGKCGVIYKRINFIWNQIRDMAGLSNIIRLHDLRHDFATRLANTGEVSIQMIGRLLRHRSAAMTQRYAHLVDETLRKASEKIR